MVGIMVFLRKVFAVCHSPCLLPATSHQGIDDGQDIPIAMLAAIFQEISEDEIRMNEGDQWEGEVVTFMAQNKAGWLSKQNHGGFHRCLVNPI